MYNEMGEIARPDFAREQKIDMISHVYYISFDMSVESFLITNSIYWTRKIKIHHFTELSDGTKFQHLIKS